MVKSSMKPNINTSYFWRTYPLDLILNIWKVFGVFPTSLLRIGEKRVLFLCKCAVLFSQKWVPSCTLVNYWESL
jgi:hypothetical protein